MQPLCHADTMSVYYIFVFEFFILGLFQLVIKALTYLNPNMAEQFARDMTESQLPVLCLTEKSFAF